MIAFMYVHVCIFVISLFGHDIVITLCNVYVYILSYLQSGQTALMKASSGGHVECVKLLLDKSVDVNHQDSVSAVSLSVWHIPLCNSDIVHLCNTVKVTYVLSGNNCALDATQSGYRSYQCILMSTKMWNLGRTIKMFVCLHTLKHTCTVVYLLSLICVTGILLI